MSRTITSDDRLKLIGLVSLAVQHNQMLKDIERAVAAIVNEPNDGYGYFGHVSDTVYQADGNAVQDVDGMLHNLEVVVTGPETP